MIINLYEINKFAIMLSSCRRRSARGRVIVNLIIKHTLGLEKF